MAAKEIEMPGGDKPIPECSTAEIRALLIAGTLISALLLVGSYFSGQPKWFLWPLRAACCVGLISLWYQGVSELRARKRLSSRQP
jgi:hypothetical protein